MTGRLLVRFPALPKVKLVTMRLLVRSPAPHRVKLVTVRLLVRSPALHRVKLVTGRLLVRSPAPPMLSVDPAVGVMMCAWLVVNHFASKRQQNHLNPTCKRQRNGIDLNCSLHFKTWSSCTEESLTHCKLSANGPTNC